MTRYVLVVVDMQPVFTRNKSTVAAVVEEVSRARESGAPVIVLEIPYHRPKPEEPYPRTHRKIMDSLLGYERFWVGEKLGSDGSRAVLRILNQHGIQTDALRLCGVKTDLCVAATVRGLLRRSRYSLEVVKKACDTLPAYRNSSWFTFPRSSRLRIIAEETRSEKAS